MSEKKYVSLNRLANYDALIKAEITEGDTNAVSSAVNTSKSYAKSYTDSEINKIKDGTTTVAKATNATSATSANSATKATQDGNGKTISSTYETKSDASAKLDTAKSYTDTKVSGLASTTVVDNKITTHNTSTSSHSDIRELITALTTKLNKFLDVDDTTSDQLSEVLTLIENNKGTLESLTSSKVNVSDIIDNLTTSNKTKVLSANQGVAIKALIDALETEVDGKANASHTHTIANITNLQATLDGKAASSHNHTVSQISDLTVSATELNYMDGVTSNVQTQLDAKSASGHTHNYAGSSSAGGAATSANKLNTNDGSATQPVYFSNGVPKATTYSLNKTVPSNAQFTDSHYESKNVVGATNATSNTAIALANGAVYLNSVENGAVTSSHKISGSGATTVTTDTKGNIIINSTDNNTTYDAAGSSLGLVKSGGDVTISNGTITVNDDSHNHTIANVDNLQSSLDAKQATITGGASTITGSNLTASRALISNSSGKVAVSDVTSTELGYLDGVTSNLQTQLDGKAASSHNHAASNITSGTLSSDRLPTVPIAKGGTGATTAAAALTNLGITATATELNYVDGVTSNVQTQLNGKAASSHTHSASEITAGTLNGSLTIGSGRVIDFITMGGKFRIMGGGSTDTASIRLVDSGNHVIKDILQVNVNTGEITGGEIKTELDSKSSLIVDLALPSNINMNDYKTAGEWFCATWDVYNTITNAPPNATAGIVRVTTGSVGYYIYQEWKTIDGQTFSRVGTNYGASWTDWKKANTAEIIALYSVSVTFSSGKATYTNSAIKANSIVIAQTRSGTVGNNRNYTTSSAAGSVTITSDAGLNSTVTLNIIIINP